MEPREEGGNNSFVWQLPTRVKYPNIKLSRPLGRDTAKIAKWFSSLTAGYERQTGTIEAMRADGTLVASWELEGVVPVRWSGPSFTADSPKVLVETVEIAHHGFTASNQGSDRMSPSPVAFSAAKSKTSSGSKSGTQGLAHAFLLLHEPSPSGSLDKPGPQIDQIDFQFNPKELSLSKSTEWKRHTASGNKKASPPQYLGSQPSKLSLEMFFDTSETAKRQRRAPGRGPVQRLRPHNGLAQQGPRATHRGCSSGGAD